MRQMWLKIILALGIIFLGLFFLRKNLWNTKESTEPIVEESVFSEELPDDFINFYNAFHSDSAFQMEHILFPLQGKPANTDSIEAIDNFNWYAKDWKLHRPFNDMGGAYQRDFQNFNNIISEKIYRSGGQFRMTRRFAKLGGVWNLIYYEEMRQY